MDDGRRVAAVCSEHAHMRTADHLSLALLWTLGLLLVACDPAGTPPPAPSAPTTAPDLPALTPTAQALLSPAPTATDSILPGSPVLAAATATSALAPAAQAYLERALNWIQENSIYRDTFDWATWRRKVLAYPVAAQTPADTYPIIRYAIGFLHDGHDLFYPPDQAQALQQDQPLQEIGLLANYTDRRVATVLPDSGAAAAGIRPGDTIQAINGTPAGTLTFDQFFIALLTNWSTQLTLQRDGVAQPWTVTLAHDNYYYPVTAPSGQSLPNGIGMIALPGVEAHMPIGAHYAWLAQQEIRWIGRAPRCGWILDLREDTGGRIYPMLAGIGPILGDGVAGHFVKPAEQHPWGYNDGIAWEGDVTRVATQVAPSYHLAAPLPPVAILTGPDTASAGEAIVISFSGRAATRRFGQPTAGAPNAPEILQLSDGAQLEIAVTMEADRTGRLFDGPIAPDDVIPANPRLTGTDYDPVILAAQRWLSSQPSCAH